jgi:hypothetical protein
MDYGDPRPTIGLRCVLSAPFLPPLPDLKTTGLALRFPSAAPIRGAGLGPRGLRPPQVGGSWRRRAGAGPEEAERTPPRAALKLAPPPAHELRPTLSVTKGAQPMSSPERLDLQATRWEGELRGGGREVEGGLRLIDSSLEPILHVTYLSNLRCWAQFSVPLAPPSSPPPQSFSTRPTSPPPLCGQIAAGKRRGPKRQTRVES